MKKKSYLGPYEGYYGSYEISIEDNVFFGKIEFITELISYEGTTPKSLEKAFEAAVDDYLETCEKLGKEPDRPFKGSFNVRIGENLHRLIAIHAHEKEVSINAFNVDALKKACNV
jgi:predicted HicB family RNase H-like nuclease